jgi:hypothetical protein
MGVELGKVLAKAILAQLGTPDDVKGHDSSVRPIISCLLSDCDIPVLPDAITDNSSLLFTDDGAHTLLPEVQERMND